MNMPDLPSMMKIDICHVVNCCSYLRHWQFSICFEVPFLKNTGEDDSVDWCSEAVAHEALAFCLNSSSGANLLE